jgi:hypothetical protein
MNKDATITNRSLYSHFGVNRRNRSCGVIEHEFALTLCRRFP